MHVYAQRQTDTKIQCRNRSAAAADKGERDTDNRENAQAHADVDECLEGDHREHADTNIFSKIILRNRGIQQNLECNQHQQYNYTEGADKSKGFANESEDEIVLDLRYAGSMIR